MVTKELKSLPWLCLSAMKLQWRRIELPSTLFYSVGVAKGSKFPFCKAAHCYGGKEGTNTLIDRRERGHPIGPFCGFAFCCLFPLFSFFLFLFFIVGLLGFGAKGGTFILFIYFLFFFSPFFLLNDVLKRAGEVKRSMGNGPPLLLLFYV